MFTSTNYKICVSVGLNVQSINKIEYLIDMGTDPNMINKSVVNQTWAPRVKSWKFLKHRSANKQPTRSEEVLMSILQTGQLPIRVCFGVDEDLPGNLVLGLEFIAQYVQGIFPAVV